jgi:hypothetical protein
MNLAQAVARTLAAWLERVPPFGQMRGNTRRGLVTGAGLGWLTALAVGALLGGLRRGWGGALVGGLSSGLIGMLVGGLVAAIWGRYRLPQEGSATLAIELDGARGHFAPGDEISGSLHLAAANTLFFRGGEVSLVCRGFFTYDQLDDEHPGQPQFVRDEHAYSVVALPAIPPQVLRRGAHAHYPFRFTIPADALPTHMGHVCSVRWSLHALAEIPDLPTLEARREVLVEGATPALASDNGSYQATTRAQPCHLVLTLARAVCCEGERLQARARIDALEPFGAAGVRAVLLRIEHTPRGRDHLVYVSGWDPVAEAYDGHSTPGGHGTTYVWLEDEKPLLGPATYIPPQTMTLPFEFTLPEQMRPSFDTAEGSVRWKVGVVVSRLSEPDVRAFHEVVVYTAIPHTPEPAAFDGSAAPR